ncbi:MAG: hypothetical protein ACREN8_05240 [Candidatus Dormibacteraceae bacterium]
MNSGQFVLTVMELWLEALHGKELLSSGIITVHPIGCKRSYTPNDQELDVNLPTTSGGVCMIHDGGNTGSTAKSPFIAHYIVQKMRMFSAIVMGGETMRENFSGLRQQLAKTVEQVPSHRWKELSTTISDLLS